MLGGGKWRIEGDKYSVEEIEVVEGEGDRGKETGAMWREWRCS